MLKLTDEVREDILHRVANGQSLRSACAAHNIVASAVIKACSKDADFGEQYARAKDEGIDSQAEEMHDLEMRVLSGELDANAFRAAMDARKWRLARQAPRKYGDKVTQAIEGGDKPVEMVFKWKS